MRIAFIGHKRIPSREGGIEIVVDELATRMAARGEQVIAFNRKGHNVAGAVFDNASNQNSKPFMYRGVKVNTCHHYRCKRSGRAHLVILCHSKGYYGPP